ncbi:MAG: 4Fe-4S dicluster domain-containing protein [Oscillospiraceae bacterium]
MNLFDTQVQQLKYRVLKSVAEHAFNDELEKSYFDIPREIVKGGEATMRCCIYKERAIVEERVKLACGGDRGDKNIINVISIACDECPVSSYQVSDSCRGCIARRCIEACPKGAITFEKHFAKIDSTKCVECGKCASVCPYNAIFSKKRPCEKACKVKAINMAEDQSAEIDHSKCISCGACVYQCPFGAVVDKSFILDAISIIKNSEENKRYKVYAVVAPSIAAQFNYATSGQVVAGLKKLGFFSVVEAALGADIVADKESGELLGKGFLTSSCCPAFVEYIQKNYPTLADAVSHNLSPMAEISKYIKSTDERAKVVFIGPCTAKKMERQKEEVKPYVDCVLTFEELQALIDSRQIKLSELEEDVLDNASYYGRIFARTGGLSEAVAQALKENNVTSEKFEFNPSVCNGIDECKMALLKASKGVLKENFIEGMACVGGCIGGAGCLTHETKDKMLVDNYGKLAKEKTIKSATNIILEK